MKFRKQRIAFSATCLIACVLLIALWVRSYSYMDTIICYRDGNWYEIQSLPVGRLQAKFMSPTGLSDGWFFRSGEHTEERYRLPILGWTGRHRSVILVYCAHWVAALVTSALAAAPWVRTLRWQFSLRTLLIATTMIAMILGLIVALSW